MIRTFFRFLVFFAGMIAFFFLIGLLQPFFTNPIIFIPILAFVLIVILKLVLRGSDA